MAERVTMSNSKTILLSLFLIFLSACSEPTVDVEELVERDGVFYEKFSTEPFNGEVVGSTRGRLEDGKWTGEVFVFGKDGSLVFERNYRNGVKHGDHLFYGGGFLRTRYTYEEGEKLRFTRFREGVIVVDSHFKGGLWHGTTAFFYDNGNLQYQVHYENGEMLEDVLDVFSSDGDTHLKVPIYQNVTKEGSWTYADGAVEIVGNDDCAVRYDKGRDPVLIVDIEFDNDDPQAIERNKQRKECTEVIEKIIDDASLTNYVVENLFPGED